MMTRASTKRGARATPIWLSSVLGTLLVSSSVSLAASEGKPLKVCLLAFNAPYSTRAEERGFDLDTARAVASHLSRPLEIEWTDNDPHIEEFDDSDFPLRKLAKGACDVIFSVPGPVGDTMRESPKLTLGANYYGAAFELLSCDSAAPKRLRALRGMSIAIQSQTIAHFAALMVKAKPASYFSLDAAITGLQKHETDAALLWGPTTGWRLNEAKSEADKACGFVAGYEPPAAVSWNLAVATRKEDEALRKGIDAALTDLNTKGELKRIAARHGVPLRAPFERTYSLGALNDLQQGR